MISGKLEILRGSDALDISDLANYVVEEAEGFGFPPVNRIHEQGPLQHGETDLGYRLQKRVIQCVLMLRATDWAAHFARRQELLDYLNPASDLPVILRFTLPDGITIRQIDGYCAEGPQFAKKDAKLYQLQRAAFRLGCPDPAWYDPVRQSVRVVGGGGGSGFEFPGAVPWTFGGDDINTEIEIGYLGSWIEYPEIVITGPITSPIIEHLDTGAMLDFSGVTIDDGDYYTVDLRYGYKTILDSAGANKIADLSAASDLATWHLQPGDNNISLTGAGETRIQAY